MSVLGSLIYNVTVHLEIEKFESWSNKAPKMFELDETTLDDMEKEVPPEVRKSFLGCRLV